LRIRFFTWQAGSVDEFPFLGRDEHRAVGMVSGGQILPAFRACVSSPVGAAGGRWRVLGGY